MNTELLMAMMEYYVGDARRINHFLKVHSFTKLIGEREQLDVHLQHVLEIAAITHDIGIKVSEEKYQSSAGHYQQIEGPGVAKELLVRLGYEADVVERVCYLIAHHHTYTNIEGLDYQILVEADFLVNIYEDEMKEAAIRTVKEKIFKTRGSIHLLNTLYLTK